jgi:tetratricopeptide (TPR) repeat protein
MSKRLPNAVCLFCLATSCFFSELQGFGQSSSDFDRAVAEFRVGHYEQAASMFARIEAASPGGTDALLYRAKCLGHLQQFPEAELALRGYLRSSPNSSDALYMLGFVLNRENRPADSLAVYTKAAAIANPTADDLKIVGLNYVLLNDYADAIKWLEHAVALDAANKEAWYYLGRAYYTKAMLGEARRAFERILDLDPKNARAKNNLGLILETEGQPDAAIQAYRESIAWQEQNQTISEQPYVNLGNLLAEQGRPREAIEPLKKAVALAPNDAYCHLTLGLLYRKFGEVDDAQRELVRATELEPDNAKAHYQLGRLYKDMNDLTRAKAEFDRVAELQSRASKPVSQQP